MLSISEKDFIVDSVRKNIRLDGRTRLGLRNIELEHGMLVGANGSAKGTILSEGTSVLVSVKLQIVEMNQIGGNGNEEVEDAADDVELTGVDNGKFRCHVDIWGKARAQMRTYDKDSIRTEISQIMNYAFNESGVLDGHKLIIIPNKLQWIINMDVSILEFGGNLVDLTFLVARTALWDTKIPKLNVESLNDGVFEYSVDDCMAEEPMIVDDLPIAVTMHKVRYELNSR
jgi:exosome complex component RRP42